MEFRWNAWNRDHATKHGVSPEEAEHVVRFAKRPYPRQVGHNKWVVEGRGASDRFVRVVYVTDADDTAYVIHAMPLGGRSRRKRRN
jgi:uncharacterized DUF497 family protein